MYDDSNPVERFFRILWVLMIVYGQVFGIIHSYKYHSKADTIVSIIFPPWAWYRSIELFWHDDNDVTFQKINKDLIKCIELVNNSIDSGVDIEGVQNKLNELKEKFTNYPTYRKEYLYTGTIIYFKLMYSMIIDSKNAFKEYSESGRFKVSTSDKTKRLERKLVKKYNLRKEVEELKIIINGISENSLSRFPNTKRQFDSNTKAELDEFIIYLSNKFQSIDNEQITLLNMLFPELEINIDEIE